VTLEEFREEVYRQFGKRLERATPANVQEFIVHMQAKMAGNEARGQAVEINETANSYEEIMTQFFARVLEAPPAEMEQALVQLWLLGFELHFARLQDEYQQKFAPLFGTDLEG